MEKYGRMNFKGVGFLKEEGRSTKNICGACLPTRTPSRKSSLMLRAPMLIAIVERLPFFLIFFK